MIESERLLFIRRNHNVLRADKYLNLQGVVSISDGPSNITGRRIILPSTYPGSPRFMTEIYHDAMGICKTYGYTDVFITFTCNSKWPENTRFVNSRGLRPEDRPDILSRVFKMKLDNMVKDLKKENWFGRVIACKL
jgi:helitron helicase-like protein